MNSNICKSEIITDYIVAKKIVSESACDNTRLFLSETPRQAVLGNKNLCVIKNGGYVLLDFGQEFCGGVVVTVHEVEHDNVSMRIVFGESVSEALSDIGEKNSCNDHSLRDSVVKVNNYTTFRNGYTGFRFVKLEAVGGDITLSGVCAAFDHRDIEFKGDFECNDELINKIWHTGARTVFLNMQDYLWDGIKRDRLVWVGDMHAEVSAISCVFGDCGIVNKTLDFIMDTSPIDEWMNGIASYSLWWILIQNDWYKYTGNVSYVKHNAGYIISHIKHIVSSVNYDGTDTFECNLGYLDDNNEYKNYFVDWETYGKEESKAGFYALLMLALKASSSLCSILGEKELLSECIAKMGVIESIYFPYNNNRQITSLMVLAGLENSDSANKRLLSVEPVADITAFLGYYTLIAKAHSGDINGALDIIRKYWGKMLELGATTFWESFHYPSSHDACPVDKIPKPGQKDIHGDSGDFCYKGFRASLCHGWACGPTPFLINHVAGIQILEPGCKKMRISPNLGNLEWVRVKYPTPYGMVNVSVKKTPKGISVSTDAPPEVEIVK